MDLNFFQTGAIPVDAMQGTYNSSLVALSYIIAVFASYLALDFTGRLRSETIKRIKYYWLAGGAVAMGAGIWSMHFIGMLAFKMPMPMGYSAEWTAISMIVAVIVSGFALFLLRTEGRSKKYMISGGILLGCGIATMHYTGMQAMAVAVNIRYLPGLFSLSILIAITASEAALWLAIKSNDVHLKQQLPLKILSALVMGAAICGMHYTGMAAAVFTILPNPTGYIPGIGEVALAISIARTVGFIIMMALIVSAYKQVMITATQNEKNFLSALLNNLEDGVIACDAKGHITVFNVALRNMINIGPNESVTGAWKNTFLLGENQEAVAHPISNMPLFDVLSGANIHNTEMTIRTNADSTVHQVLLSGQKILGAHDEKLGAVLVLHDITDRREMEKQIVQQATHDSLTGLLNRNAFQEKLINHLMISQQFNKSFYILFIDIDNFKNINDSLGHHAGDTALVLVAERLGSVLRNNDALSRSTEQEKCFSRFGGDEFVVLLTNIKDTADVNKCVERITKAFRDPFRISEKSLHIGLSIGVACYPEDGDSWDTLIQHADLAMYHAKELGRNNFQFYSARLGELHLRNVALMHELRKSLGTDALYIMYQPQYKLGTKSMRGIEALLRWDHPSLGPIAPSEFIPLAEKSGLISMLGDWILEHACLQYVSWLSADKISSDIILSVNVSPYQLVKNEFQKTLHMILEKTNMPVASLELEITETALMTQLEGSESVLNALKDMGISLSIDDFGTGYSSLSRIKHLPITTIKIDKTFTDGITTNTDDPEIVKSILALAHALKLTVIAEGVERFEQMEFLLKHHCPIVQGFYFSRALTTAEMEKKFNYCGDGREKNDAPGTADADQLDS